MNAIHYESLVKWKYRLTAPLTLQCSVRAVECRTEYIQLKPNGLLTLSKGYAWNGATGAIDTQNSMAGSAGHDALYQLIALGLLTPDLRWNADRDLRRWLREDGMSALRAEAWYLAVRGLGGFFVEP